MERLINRLYKSGGDSHGQKERRRLEGRKKANGENVSLFTPPSKLPLSKRLRKEGKGNRCADRERERERKRKRERERETLIRWTKFSCPRASGAAGEFHRNNCCSHEEKRTAWPPKKKRDTSQNKDFFFLPKMRKLNLLSAYPRTPLRFFSCQRNARRRSAQKPKDIKAKKKLFVCVCVRACDRVRGRGSNNNKSVHTHTHTHTRASCSILSEEKQKMESRGKKRGDLVQDKENPQESFADSLNRSTRTDYSRKWEEKEEGEELFNNFGYLCNSIERKKKIQK